MILEEFFAANTSVALGFSGGVDSSYVLYAGLHYGAEVKPYFVKTAFQPEYELKDAYKLAEHLGIEITVMNFDILDNDAVISNPSDRCYFCKMTLFTALQKQALLDGFTILLDGTNFSDDATDRPGMKALSQLNVRSPLRECGLTKDDVRQLSRQAGLFTWDKPSYSCLATRIPVGRTITASLLQRVEAAETSLFALGFTDFRVRVHGESARLQFPEEQLSLALTKRTEIIESIKPYFEAVLMDMEGR